MAATRSPLKLVSAFPTRDGKFRIVASLPSGQTRYLDLSRLDADRLLVAVAEAITSGALDVG